MTNPGSVPRVDGGPDPVDHLLPRHHFLAGTMTAALGADLVLQMHGAGTCLDHRANRARDVECAAPARVDVDQQRQRRDFGDPADIDEDVLQRADPQVGHAERIRGDAAAGQVQRLETCALGHARGIGIDGADHLQRVLGGDGGTELRACGSMGHFSDSLWQFAAESHPDGCGHHPSIAATPARSSSSSFSVAFILSREKSSTGRSGTRVYSPPAVVTGTPYTMSFGMP